MYKEATIKQKISVIDYRLNDIDRVLSSIYIEGNPYKREDEIAKLECEYYKLMDKRKILSDKLQKGF